MYSLCIHIGLARNAAIMNWKPRIEGWDKLAEDDKDKYFIGKLCECGCGQGCKIGKRFVNGHNIIMYWNEVDKNRRVGRPNK